MEEKKDFFSKFYQNFGLAGVIWLVIVLLVFGGLGSLLVNRLVLPYLGGTSFFGNVSLIQPEAPLVVNRREEVIIDDGINLAEVANRVRDSVVKIYSYTGTPGEEGFQVSGSISGLIVSSDGLILTSTIDPVSSTARLWASNSLVSAPAELIASDPVSGLSFLKIEQNNLPVVRQGFSREVQLGQRLIAVRPEAAGEVSILPTTNLRENRVWPGFEQTYNSGEFALSVEIEDNLDLLGPGVGVFDRDANLIGVNVSKDGELKIFPSEAVNLVIGNYLDDKVIVWPGSQFEYQLLSSNQAALIGFDPNQVAELNALVVSSPSGVGGELLRDDLILLVDGQSLDREEGLNGLFLEKTPGDEVVLQVLRDGEILEVKIILE